MVKPPLLAAWCDPGKKCPLGTPTDDVTVGDDGTLLQTFQRGVLFKSPGERIERLLRRDGDDKVTRNVIGDDRESNAVG